MIAYKLFRVVNGQLHSLFINKTEPIEIGVWLDADNFPTKGFKVRPGWHCTSLPHAPHLKMKPKGQPERIWCKVEIEDYTIMKRPASQGGTWYLANKMKVVKALSDSQVNMIRVLSYTKEQEEALERLEIDLLMRNAR
jgi:hypothetical protein